jgi:hypothetical protein
MLRPLDFQQECSGANRYDSYLARYSGQKRQSMSITDPFNEQAWDRGNINISINAHSTPDPDSDPGSEPPGPNPNPDDVPPPARAPVREPTLPEPPIKANQGLAL